MLVFWPNYVDTWFGMSRWYALDISDGVTDICNWHCILPHNSQIYDECLSQPKKIRPYVSWERDYQDDSNLWLSFRSQILLILWIRINRAYFSAFGPKLNFPEMLKLNLKTLKLNLKILKLNLKPPKLPNIVNFTPISKYLFWNLVNIAS